jgi:chorismate mutase
MQDKKLDLIRKKFDILNNELLELILKRIKLGKGKYKNYNEKYDLIYTQLLEKLNLVNENNNKYINTVDQKIINLIKKRTENLSINIAEIKLNFPISNKNREKEILKSIKDFSYKNKLNFLLLKDFFKKIIKLSKKTQINYLKEKYNLIVKN